MNNFFPDHSCSLVPDELALLVQMIRIAEKKQLKSKDTDSVVDLVKSIISEIGHLYLLKHMDELKSALIDVNENEKKLLDCEISCFNKLGKTLVYAHDIPAGKVTTKTDFDIKVNIVKGVPTERINLFIGKRLLKDVEFEEAVQFEHIC